MFLWNFNLVFLSQPLNQEIVKSDVDSEDVVVVAEGSQTVKNIEFVDLTDDSEPPDKLAVSDTKVCFLLFLL